ncbi:MAG: hypothetical protein ACXWQO_20345 [Bdellovibrionota bacterium]
MAYFNYILCLLALGLAPVSGLSAGPEVPDVEMHAMTKEILALQKFLFSDSTFTAPENEAAIKSSLAVVNRHLSYLNKGTFASDPALKTNLRLITQLEEDAQKAFLAGEKHYARYMLLSSTQMCIACHTRTQTRDFTLPEAELTNATALERGDFFFATRQFDKGMNEYTKILAAYPANKLSEVTLRQLLISAAVYYSRVKADPGRGQEFFAKLSKNNSLPADVRNDLKAWANDFALWKKEKKETGLAKSEEELWKKANSILEKGGQKILSSHEQKFNIARLRASSLLHQILEMPGDQSALKAETLYALGRIYDAMDYQLLFRFGEMYLKACISEYAKTPAAQKCFGALETAVKARVSGDSQDEIDLAKLKKLAF